MKERKYIDIKEFREGGYLQELNRQFLHPLGLALEVVIDDDGTERLGGVWDSRDEKEGFYFDLDNSDDERQQKFIKNCIKIENEFLEKSNHRAKNLGFVIEPIKK